MNVAHAHPVDWRRALEDASILARRRYAAEVADEIVASGVERVFAGDPPHDPAAHGPLFRFIVALGINLLRNARRRRTEAPPDSRPVVAPSPASLYDAASSRARRLARLLARCDDDERTIVELERADVLGRKAQADHLGWTEQRVKNVRKRLAMKIEKVLADEDREGTL